MKYVGVIVYVSHFISLRFGSQRGLYVYGPVKQYLHILNNFVVPNFKISSILSLKMMVLNINGRCKMAQQTLKVDSTLIYVHITLRLRSMWYPHWFNIDFSTLIHRINSTLKQLWLWVYSKNSFVLISWCLKN